MRGPKIKKEDQISWTISIPMILLAAVIWTVLDRNWNSLNHLPVYVYAGTLIFSLKAEKFAYRGGSDLPGIQSDKWTRYLLLFFWWLLLILPALEYSLFPGYSPAVTATGTFLAVSGTILRAWGGIWTWANTFPCILRLRTGTSL